MIMLSMVMVSLRFVQIGYTKDSIKEIKLR